MRAAQEIERQQLGLGGPSLHLFIRPERLFDLAVTHLAQRPGYSGYFASFLSASGLPQFGNFTFRPENWVHNFSSPLSGDAPATDRRRGGRCAGEACPCSGCRTALAVWAPAPPRDKQRRGWRAQVFGLLAYRPYDYSLPVAHHAKHVLIFPVEIDPEIRHVLVEGIPHGLNTAAATGFAGYGLHGFTCCWVFIGGTPSRGAG